jgi:predicted NAD/FAD-binding protein
MKIAIVGAGIAGLSAAWYLRHQHSITLFEANDYAGGHTDTHSVSLGAQTFAVDTGFIVFNDWTYPNFITLLNELDVASQPTTMSFSVQCEATGIEYNGNNLNTLFAQRRNLIRPAFYRMLRDILRFNRTAPELLTQANAPANTTVSLLDYLHSGGYSQTFIDHYIIPMGAAIWSSDPATISTMPALFFIRFFNNHGLLSVNQRPQWRVIQGGSQRYVDALTAPLREHIRLRCPVRQIKRLPTHIEINSAAQSDERFDAVIIATHSDQALRCLADPSPTEKAILGAIPYQQNEVVLHTDTRLLPRRKLAWAAWNYAMPSQASEQVAVTYNMNLLQGLQAAETVCVSLNSTASIEPSCILARRQYQHPVFNPDSIAAQHRHAEINGVNRTWYCGAYWGNGFHEDGVVSALQVVENLQQLALAA